MNKNVRDPKLVAWGLGLRSRCLLELIFILIGIRIFIFANQIRIVCNCFQETTGSLGSIGNFRLRCRLADVYLLDLYLNLRFVAVVAPKPKANGSSQNSAPATQNEPGEVRRDASQPSNHGKHDACTEEDKKPERLGLIPELGLLLQMRRSFGVLGSSVGGGLLLRSSGSGVGVSHGVLPPNKNMINIL